MLKIYVAGSSKRWERCRDLAKTICTSGLGAEITEPWYEEFATLPIPVILDLHPSTIATRDIKGVVDADILVVHIDPAADSQGLWTELGIAVMANKPTVVFVENTSPKSKMEVVEWLRRAVFLFSPGIERVYSEEDLLKAIHDANLKLNRPEPKYVWDGLYAKEPGKIVSVTEYEEHSTVFFNCEYDNGGSQGFGGISLNPEMKRVFISEAREVLDIGGEIKDVEVLIMKYSFDYGFQANIAGLKNPITGKIFTIHEFRKKHFGLDTDPLAEHIQHLRETIEYNKHRAGEIENEIQTAIIRGGYVG